MNSIQIRPSNQVVTFSMPIVLLAFIFLMSSVLSAHEQYYTEPFGESPQDTLLRIYSETNDDASIDIYADNDNIISVYLILEFTRLQNMSANIDLPFQTALDPNSRGNYLFTITPEQGKSYSYSYRYTHSLGDPNAVHDDSYLYSFPFAHGSKHKITQGFNGKVTHSGDNQYAIDFDLEEGTPVYSARSGTVVEVKEDSNRGGLSAQYRNTGNFIRILHSDGSFGTYVHLQQNGSIVEIGEEVGLNQHIGYSGNTGNSSGPHLHFDVRLAQFNGRSQSIPFRFKGIEGEPIVPEAGEYYYAFHEGGEAFDIVYGSDLSNADFAQYSGEASVENTVNVRSETYDDSNVVFIANGFTYDIEVTVNIRLQSMTSTVALPIILNLEAGEERFLSILRPVKGAVRSGYQTSLSYRPISN